MINGYNPRWEAVMDDSVRSDHAEMELARESPRRQLILLLLTLRGGKTRLSHLRNDLAEWIEENGEPTPESVREWVRTHPIEFKLGMAASESRLR